MTLGDAQELLDGLGFDILWSGPLVTPVASHLMIATRNGDTMVWLVDAGSKIACMVAAGSGSYSPDAMRRLWAQSGKPA